MFVLIFIRRVPTNLPSTGAYLRSSRLKVKCLGRRGDGAIAPHVLVIGLYCIFIFSYLLFRINHELL